MASPTAESSNANGKRPAAGGNQNRKKPRKDDDGADHSPEAEKEGGGKVKPTRGSRLVVLSFCHTCVHVSLGRVRCAAA